MRSFLLGALMLGLSVWWLVSSPAQTGVEALYSRSLYPAFAKLIVPITNSFPVSLAGILLVLLPLLWLFWLRIRWRRRTSGSHWLVNSLWGTAVGAAVIFLLFVSLWGANYRRLPIEALFALPDTLPIQDDLVVLTDTLMATIQEGATAPRRDDVALASVAAAMRQLVFELTEVTPTLPDRVKRAPAGSLILLGSASGVASPWTLEPHIDGALPDVSYVAVGAHELAHIAGFAGEADADFISALAGLRATDPFARYAVALRLWRSAVAQLPPEAQNSYYEALPNRAKRDLEAMAEPYQRYQPPRFITDIQRRSYDRYLKTQGVEEGVADYSRTINLLLRAQSKGILRVGD